MASPVTALLYVTGVCFIQYFCGTIKLMAEWFNGLESSISSAAAALGPTGEMLLRLILATVAGALVGLERELRGRQAGFRTNILVCLGSAIVMVVSVSFASHGWEENETILRIDPSRIAYGVMTGVGFLGAGTIIHHGATVRGLTTAAALWCVAAIGLAIGFGLYIVAAMGCILVLMALWLLDHIEEVMPKIHVRRVTMRATWHPTCVNHAVRLFRESGFQVFDVSFERQPNLKEVDITLTISFLRMQQLYSMEQHFESKSGMTLLATKT